MKSRVLNSFEEAVADIPDGAAIMVGGFGPGTPRNLIRALARRRARDLTIICNAPGDGTDRTDVRKLVQNGCVRKVICSFVTADDPLIQRSAPKGDTIVEMVPQGTLAERIRAGGAGIPAFYTPTGDRHRGSHGERVSEVRRARPACWSTGSRRITRSFAPGRPTLSATLLTVFPSETSIPSWRRRPHA